MSGRPAGFPRATRGARTVLVALALLSACHRPSEEERIRRAVSNAAAAAEDSDVHGVMEIVADDFRGPDDLDKAGLKGVLAARLLRGDRVTVVRRNEAVQVDGDHATDAFDAALLAGDRKQLKGRIPDRIGTWHFDLTLARRDGAWVVTTASWKPIDATRLVPGVGDL